MWRWEIPSETGSDRGDSQGAMKHVSRHDLFAGSRALL